VTNPKAKRLLNAISPGEPSPKCAACGTARLELVIDTSRTSLEDLLTKVAAPAHVCAKNAALDSACGRHLSSLLVFCTSAVIYSNIAKVPATAEHSVYDNMHAQLQGRERVNL